MLGKTNTTTALIVQEPLNQNIEITKNGTYTADDGYSGLGVVTVAVSFAGIQYYGTELMFEVLHETLDNYLGRITEKSLDVLGINGDYVELVDWQYKPATIKENYQDVLTSDNDCVIKILTAVLN